MTPFRPAQVFKESVKKKSCCSDCSVFRFRDETEFALFSTYLENALENVHENVPLYRLLPIYCYAGNLIFKCLLVFELSPFKKHVKTGEKKNNNKSSKNNMNSPTGEFIIIIIIPKTIVFTM